MEYYKILFLILYATMVLIFVVKQMFDSTREIDRYLIWFFGICFILLFGFRSTDVGTDTHTYQSLFEEVGYYFDDFEHEDFGFVVLISKIFELTGNYEIIFLSIALFYVLPLMLVYSSLNTNENFLIFLFFASLVSFQALGINIIRQGVAISFAIGVFFLFQNKKYITALFVLLIAIGFHKSIILLISFYACSFFLKTPWLGLTILILSSVLSLTKFDIDFYLDQFLPFLGSEYQEKLNAYSYYDEINEDGIIYETGFRLDFFAFNIFFAAIGILCYIKDIHKNYPYYMPILNTYLLTSSFFFLKFNQIFSDRFGVLSWALIPFIIIPLADNKFANGKLITFLLAVTLFKVLN